jgi:hypothetical protein
MIFIFSLNAQAISKTASGYGGIYFILEGVYDVAYQHN